jgi:hypothetical protein
MFLEMFLERVTIVSYFHTVGKYISERAKIKVYFRTRINALEQPLLTKPGMLTNAADLDVLSHSTDPKILG